jgi:hypothetical protein
MMEKIQQQEKEVLAAEKAAKTAKVITICFIGSFIYMVAVAIAIATIG